MRAARVLAEVARPTGARPVEAKTSAHGPRPCRPSRLVKTRTRMIAARISALRILTDN